MRKKFHRTKSKESLDPHQSSSPSRFIRFTRNFSIGTKYLAALSISILLFLLATAYTFNQFSTAKNHVDDIVEKSELANNMGQLALYVEQQAALISNYIILGHTTYIDDFAEVSEQFIEAAERIEPQIINEESQYRFSFVLQNNERMTDLFLHTIVDENVSENDIISAHIRIENEKATSVELLNNIIDDVSGEQNTTVTHVNKSMDDATYLLIIINVASIVIGFIIMLVISRIISRNLKKIVSITNDISSGDLTVERMNYEGKDEIAQLAKAINALSNNMRNIIHKVAQASHSVSTGSEGLTGSAREVQEASNQMVITMEELATGAETQANSAAHLSEEMRYFVDSVQLFQQEGMSVADSSKHILTLTTDGTNLMKESVEQMDKIDHIVTDAVKQVRGLDEQSEEISKLVEVVKGIADQTNLLALNAAIEAARAGEHGLGFAVVADEVKKLAEQVTSSVTEITEIVQHIQQETGAVVSSLNNGYEEVKEGISQIEKTGESFQTIDDSISTMVTSTSEIVHKLKDIAENSDQMNNRIEDIAAVSEEAAAGVQQSSASTEETSNAMVKILQNAEVLSQLADQLNDEITVFKL